MPTFIKYEMLWVCDKGQCVVHYKLTSLMPRSHIHGSPRQFYYGLNLKDYPGNANFGSPIRMPYICVIKYYYV